MNHVLCFGRLNVTCAFCGKRAAPITSGTALDAVATLTAFSIDHAECKQFADGYFCSACGRRDETYEKHVKHAGQEHGGVIRLREVR